MSVRLQVQKLLRQKQLEIEDFSVYWDTECEMLGKLAINEIQVWDWGPALHWATHYPLNHTCYTIQMCLFHQL